jgi:hypothetical protein
MKNSAVWQALDSSPPRLSLRFAPGVTFPPPRELGNDNT